MAQSSAAKLYLHTPFLMARTMLASSLSLLGSRCISYYLPYYFLAPALALTPAVSIVPTHKQRVEFFQSVLDAAASGQ